MISATTFQCRQCGEERYQKILFVGTEFAYQCPCCEAIHLFYENIHYDINQHFKDPNWSRYVGYWYRGELVPHKKVGQGVVDKFNCLLKNQHDKTNVSVRKHLLSKREPQGKFFVTSMLHDHFQEAFRGLYHMRGAIEADIDDYKILVVPEDDRFFWLMDEPLKTKGIDEIWEVPFSKKDRWPFINNEKEGKKAWDANNAIQQELDLLEGIGTTINKRAGTLPNGKQIIKDLLEPLTPRPLSTNKGTPLFGQYVGILYKQESHDRAGLCRDHQFIALNEIICALGLRPLLIIVTEGDRVGLEKLQQPIPYVCVPYVYEQAQVFRNNIHFVIGTNCSGCNMPALYDLPMFTFAKGRRYPDDFYCFSRMASIYQKRMLPWNGECEKADNIHEEAIDVERPLEIFPYKEKIKNWIRKHVSVPKHATQGVEHITEGYKHKCPQCQKLNKSYKRVLVRSDMVRAFECSCGEHYIAYYGLTTSSLVGVFSIKQNCIEVQRYQQALRERETTTKGRNWEVHKVKETQKTNPIYFYSMKPSLGDFYYTLPCLLSLYRDFPDRKLIMVTHSEYLPLVPKGYVDEIWALQAESPYDFTNNVYSEAHKFLEKEISEHAPICSNYPGHLPADKNSYYLLGTHYEASKDVTVTVCCRLQSNRQWPTRDRLHRLQEAFEEKKWCYRFLVFPANEKVSLSEHWHQIPNLFVNPKLEQQIELAHQTRVWLAPHGAAGVIPSIANTSLVELETDPPWWKASEPQPLRFGLPAQKFRKLQQKTYNDISVESIVEAIEELL